MLHDLANDGGFVALKLAAEDREGWRHTEREDVKNLLYRRSWWWVTMDLSPTFSKINGDFCQKKNSFLHTLCTQHLRSGCLPLEIYNGVLRAFPPNTSIRQMDRRTDRHPISISRVSTLTWAIKTESRLTKCTRSLWVSSILCLSFWAILWPLDLVLPCIMFRMSHFIRSWVMIGLDLMTCRLTNHATITPMTRLYARRRHRRTMYRSPHLFLVTGRLPQLNRSPNMLPQSQQYS